MKKLIFGLLILGSVLIFAAGEKRVPIEKMELNQQNSMVYVQGEQTPFTGTVEARYENGKLEHEISYKNGKIEGIIKSYYPNGKLEEEQTYKNNVRDGITKRYYEN